jgi:protein-tyrosine phosphatase
VSDSQPEPALRVDWLGFGDLRDQLPGRLGLTFLPGKRGASMRYPGRVYRRELDADLATLGDLGVRSLLLLVEDAELERWGDPDIVERAASAGVVIHRSPLPDGTAPRHADRMDEMVRFLTASRAGGDVAVACMGGVGRTGTVAACALVSAGWTARDAISRVREVRHPTAVETDEQESFVEAYERHVSRRAGSANVAP